MLHQHEGYIVALIGVLEGYIVPHVGNLAQISVYDRVVDEDPSIFNRLEHKALYYCY